MSSINTRIVHRSNALSNGAYGDNFLYDEGVMTGKGVKGKNRARAIYWGLALFFAGAGFNVVRKLLARKSNVKAFTISDLSGKRRRVK